MPFTCCRGMHLYVLAYRTEHAACKFTVLSILRLRSINRSKLHAKYVKSGLHLESRDQNILSSCGLSETLLFSALYEVRRSRCSQQSATGLYPVHIINICLCKFYFNIIFHLFLYLPSSLFP